MPIARVNHPLGSGGPFFGVLMSVTKLPPDVYFEGNGEIIYTISDTHLGNSRPTNDLPASSLGLQQLAAYLRNLAASITDGQLNAFDLVINGDFLDFWKAVPNPLADGGAFPLHVSGDYSTRLIEILNYPAYDPIWEAMSRILWAWNDQNQEFLEAGGHIYILVGNHDDPIQFENVGNYTKALLNRILEITQNRTLTPVSVLASWMAQRLHWGATYYRNRSLRTHIEHGHYIDPENLRRDDNGVILVAQGHVIVEGFINGCHDLNLNSMKFFWERVVRTGSVGTTIGSALPLIDNFDENTGGRDFVIALAQLGGVPEPVDQALRTQILMTVWEADLNRNAVAAGQIPGVGDLVEKVYLAFFRGASGNQRQYARAQADLFGRRLTIPGVYTPVMANPPTIRVVVMGHTHREEFQPAPQLGTVDYQFVNTGTFVESRVFDPAAPLTPGSRNARFPCKISVDPANTDLLVVEVRELGGSVVYINKVKRA
jgi:UDP-2,3-diacylglucosamine pyrophosphatase LpxH